MSGIYDSFSGSITGEVLTFNPDAIPGPDTLHIRMTRGERRIADEIRKQFGGFRRVVIDVDGEQHEFGADSLIRLLEGYEGARDKSRWYELFGTPERAARTLIAVRGVCESGPCSLNCPFGDAPVCPSNFELSDYDTLLEWLRGDAE